MKELFVRVDANEIIATGHVMRCLAIADEAARQGIKPVFIFSDDNGKAIVESRGFETVVLDSVWNDLESETGKMLELIFLRKIQLLLVDSYYVTDRYLKILSANTNVVYIDDLGVITYPVWGIICYANYYEKFQYEQRFQGSETKFLLGCDYVPLRKEFYNLPAKQINESVRNLLLLSGGSDQFHVLMQMLSVLCCFDDLELDVICGRFNMDYDELISLYSKKNIHIHKSVDNLIYYMQKADLALSAGGTTLYELCACGTPTITYSIADNQIDNVIKFASDNLMPYLGDARYENISEILPEKIKNLLNVNIRKEYSNNLRTLVDGRGTERLIDELQSILVSIK